MTLKLTGLKNIIAPGTIIPMEEEHGNIGKWAEDTLEDLGWKVNRGKGVDLPEVGAEVKTRKWGSTSGHTVGAMLPQDILHTQWHKSNIHDKVQHQLRIYHKVNELTGDNVVVSAQLYDFTSDKIQKKLEQAWQHCRGVLQQGDLFDYIRGVDKWAYLEMQPNGYYQFRIQPGTMKTMERIAHASSSKLFDFGD
jgi:hypothetical protein